MGLVYDTLENGGAKLLLGGSLMGGGWMVELVQAMADHPNLLVSAGAGVVALAGAVVGYNGGQELHNFVDPQ